MNLINKFTKKPSDLFNSRGTGHCGLDTGRHHNRPRLKNAITAGRLN